MPAAPSPTPPRAGLFVTFEGVEGSGKSTQIALLAERLRAAGQIVLVTREPGGTALGDELRHLLKHHPAGRAMTPEAELLLFNASRAQLVREVIDPALAAGEVVLCDRFYDSTLAYQGYARGLDLTAVRAVVDLAVGSCRPHLTLLLDLPLGAAGERLRQRALPLADRFDTEERRFHERVAEAYHRLAAAEPGRWRVVNAAQPPEAVAGEVAAAVAAALAARG